MKHLIFYPSRKIISNIETKHTEHLTEKEIYSYLKNKFGQWILYEPEFKKNTYFLWLLPILMFLLGGAIVYKIFILKKN